MLIETNHGVLNSDHIVTVEVINSPKAGERCEVTLITGAKKIFDMPMSAFEQSCGVIVPAPDGYVLVRAIPPFAQDDGVLFIEEPVIAFRVNSGAAYDGAIPITTAGEVPGNAAVWAVRDPNGRCVGPDDHYDTLDDFKTAAERQLAGEVEDEHG